MKLLAAILCILSAASAAPMKLAWDASPNATSYQVWRGIELMESVTVPQATINLPTDQISTLTVIARNASLEAEPSIITVRPVTAQDSVDLENWQDAVTFFVLDSPAHFFRFTFPK